MVPLLQFCSSPLPSPFPHSFRVITFHFRTSRIAFLSMGLQCLLDSSTTMHSTPPLLQSRVGQGKVGGGGRLQISYWHLATANLFPYSSHFLPHSQPAELQSHPGSHSRFLLLHQQISDLSKNPVNSISSLALQGLHVVLPHYIIFSSAFCPPFSPTNTSLLVSYSS